MRKRFPLPRRRKEAVSQRRESLRGGDQGVRIRQVRARHSSLSTALSMAACRASRWPSGSTIAALCYRKTGKGAQAISDLTSAVWLKNGLSDADRACGHGTAPGRLSGAGLGTASRHRHAAARRPAAMAATAPPPMPAPAAAPAATAAAPDSAHPRGARRARRAPPQLPFRIFRHPRAATRLCRRLMRRHSPPCRRVKHLRQPRRYLLPVLAPPSATPAVP